MPKGIYIRTEKTRKILSDSKKRNPTNFWLGKKRTEETRHKISIAQMGKKQSPEVIKKRVVARSGYHPTEETKKKIGIANSGKHSWAKGTHLSATAKEKDREWHINNPNRNFKDTSIEIAIEKELLSRGIYFQKQVPLCKIAIVDFYLPEYRIVIQADGCYWHGCPESFPNPTVKQIFTKQRDKRQDAILTFNGFNVYRFWEHEIKKDVKGCIDKLSL